MLAKIYVDSYALDIVMTRSFNHLGPGQKETFVVSSFAKQMVEKKNKNLKIMKLFQVILQLLEILPMCGMLKGPITIC